MTDLETLFPELDKRKLAILGELIDEARIDELENIVNKWTLMEIPGHAIAQSRLNQLTKKAPKGISRLRQHSTKVDSFTISQSDLDEIIALNKEGFKLADEEAKARMLNVLRAARSDWTKEVEGKVQEIQWENAAKKPTMMWAQALGHRKALAKVKEILEEFRNE